MKKYYGSSDAPINPWFLTKDQKISLWVGIGAFIAIALGVYYL